MYTDLITYCLVFFLLWPGFSAARQISREEAQNAAVAFLSAKITAPGPVPVPEFYLHPKQGRDIFYIFNFCNGGYVITTTDDRFYPILAWSDEGFFSMTSMPEHVGNWMSWYEKQVELGLADPDYRSPHNKQEWEELITGTSKLLKGKDTGILPLLTCKWDQGTYYNALCPENPTGNGTRAPVGCVATAMAQVMYYFRFPQTGTGSHSYTPDYSGGIYGVQFADFGNTQYHWNEMTDVCQSPNFAIAQLSYHCGVAVDMGYTPSSSGSTILKAVNAMTEHFKYSPGIQNYSRQDYGTFEDWQALLITQLENHQPIIYRSNSGWLGHAYVCDGYQDSTHFHFNWGWSGNYNGYFYIDELVPGGININNGQGGVFNIYPDTSQYTYPEYCHTPGSITATIGSLEDGSGPQTYLPGTTCNWIIAPDDTTITNIRLDFTMLDTEENQDVIAVYAGDSPEAPLVGTYSGNSLPGPIDVESDVVFITFETNNAVEHRGWHANFIAYRLPFCTESAIVDAITGTLNDGSDFMDYVNGTDCGWLLEPLPPTWDSVERVRIEFNYMDLASGDSLLLYDGPDETAPLLGSFTGNMLPADLESSFEKIFIRFVTDDAETAGGWSFNYYPVHPVYCHDTTLITEQHGYIEDGSGNKHYVSNTDCYWHIEIPEAEYISIEMLEVDMEMNYDYLDIYDGANTLRLHTTGNIIPEPLTIEGNTALVHFHSDYRDNSQGWKLFYYSTAEAVEESGLPSFTIHPNPVNDFCTIERVAVPA